MKNLFYNNGKLSLGRISFWIVFIIIISYWVLMGYLAYIGKPINDIPASLFNVFSSLLIYNTATKGKDLIQKAIDNKGNKSELLNDNRN